MQDLKLKSMQNKKKYARFEREEKKSDRLGRKSIQDLKEKVCKI